MKTAFAGVVVLCLATTLPLSAQSTTTTTSEDATQPTTTQSTTTAPAKPKDSALVKAARQTGTTPKMPKKVITNADVKKSKGKIGTTAPKPIPAVIDEGPKDPRGMVETANDTARARKAADDRIAAAQTRFDALQKDLSAIEQAYYQEKDPNIRDTVIQQRFAQTKRQLEAARKELADARDAREALNRR